MNLEQSDSQSQIREFQVDKHIIFDLVFKQANSLEGAIGELIMNAFDAESTEIKINISRDGIRVQDNGRGFRSKDEITEFFEIFGRPRNETNDNKFGRFRMGRGQIMAFTQSVWRSGGFQMDVDVKNRGLNYTLSSVSPLQGGCCIEGEWYKPLRELCRNHFFHHTNPDSNDDMADEQALERLLESLSRRFRYIQRVKIRINGDWVNDNSKTDWDYEDDTFLFKGTFDKGYSREIEVFNLGSFITRIKTSRIKAVVVTKRHMSLNVTRSEVQADCEVLSYIMKTLRTLTPRLNPTKKYGIEESIVLIKALIFNELSLLDVVNLKMFPDIQRSRFYTLKDLVNKPFTIAEPNSLLADMVHTSGQVVLHEVFNERYHFDNGSEYYACSTIEALSVWFFNQSQRLSGELKKSHIRAYHALNGVTYRPLISFEGEFDGKNKILTKEELDHSQRRVLEALQKVNKDVARLVLNKMDNNKVSIKDKSIGIVFDYSRTIVIGQSAQNDGWTDSNSYIAINAQFLSELDQGFAGGFGLISLLCHEYCHKPNSDFNGHDYDFYELYHNVVSDHHRMWSLVTKLLRVYDDIMAKACVKPKPGIIKAHKSIRNDSTSRALVKFNENKE